MDYSHIFRQTWNVLRRSGDLWALGFAALSLSLMSNLITRLGGRWVTSQALTAGPDIATQVEQWLVQLGRPGPIVLGVVGLMGWFLLIWLVMTVGEAGMIHAAATTHKGHPATLLESVRAGWRLLIPFVAIDTVVFLPLFVLILVMMLIGAAALIISIIWGAQSGQVSAFVLPVVLGGAIVLLLSFLLIPTTLVTMLFRTLAFRAAALLHLGVRESIHHTWQLIRQKTGPVIILAALIYGLSYLVGIASAVVLMPLSFLEGTPSFSALASGPSPAVLFSPLTLIVVFLNVVIAYGVQVLTTVAGSTFWTVAYQDLTEE